MLPSARVQTAIDLLEKTGASRIPMDSTIGDYMRHRKYIGSKDRASIVERVYAIERARARLGWWLGHAGAPDTARNRMMAWLVLAEGEGLNAIDKLCDGSKYAPEPLQDDEKVLIERLSGKKLDSEAVPESERVECPPQWESRLRDFFGKDFKIEMTAMLGTAPLDLRVNTRLIDRESAMRALAVDGIKTDPTGLSPWGLRCRGKAYLSESKVFRDGMIEIQDEGSQLIAYVAGVQPGMQVLDYCAGAGGKTLALAAAMKNKGRIVAMDIAEGRLEKARPRFRRAGVADIIEVRALSDEKNRKWLRRQKESFDLVLADVPCSGTGTWRRNPDMRWRNYGPGLDELLETQADILERVARAVKLGGRLVYATCSLLPDENERQIETFLAAHPEFELLPLDQVWEDGQAPSTPCLRLTPYRHDTDGFFAAVLVRTKSAIPQNNV
ncbi:MAG: RsmB/NOP family class I SAM-dependent RNA methyltransferase [Micavibrio aeruginosavorus]|uniref:RsmB/NOP family class I SAM-dependent RNA methyltransferase n=1 Tax=Micavibrio aeruginosavorus TaxID=349221 RepID=A0A7T5R325_9BACT|nr:MAG: RsmB/NOP family class I SAM-dependent RNA methyltransferase [Micavibrio aeruginosavorus]